MKKIKPSVVKGIQNILNESKHVGLVTHIYPDGDTLGGAFALRYFLRKKNIESSIICKSKIPEFLLWMLYNDNINSLYHKDYPEKLDAIFFIDHNSFGRSEKLDFNIEKISIPKIIIDHHPLENENADYIICDTTASSTCELIYFFIDTIGETNLIDEKAAACLYAGIMTDTGNFSYGIKNPKTFEVIFNLLKKGIDKDIIYENVYHNYSLNRLKLLGTSFLKNLTILDNKKAAYIVLNNHVLKWFNYKPGDAEGLVNYPLSMRGIKISILIMELDNLIKISFRSKGNTPINDYAKEVFQGGGHLNAAGAISTKPLKKIIDVIIDTLPNFIEKHKI